MNNIGYHILLDLYGCTENLKFVDQNTVLQDIAKQVGLNVVGASFHQFEPVGVTGAILLAESHITFHTWVDEQHVSCDIYTCNSKNEHLAKQMITELEKHFKADPTKSVVTNIRRSFRTEDNSPGEHIIDDHPDKFTEVFNESESMSFCGKKVAAGQTDFAKWEVIDTAEFGRTLRINDVNQVSKFDYRIYNNAMFNYRPKSKLNILILGGGDCTIASDAVDLNHNVTMVEIDKDIIEVSKKYFLDSHQIDNLDKVNFIIGDAKTVVDELLEAKCKFDIVIFDLTDPDDTSSDLYTEQFFCKCKELLRHYGILTCHVGSPIYNLDRVTKGFRILRKVFSTVRQTDEIIPSYGGKWSFATCVKL